MVRPIKNPAQLPRDIGTSGNDSVKVRRRIQSISRNKNHNRVLRKEKSESENERNSEKSYRCSIQGREEDRLGRNG